jgi:hypothetical protein
MKKYRWMFYLFFGIGGMLLVIALLLWNTTRDFLANARVTRGAVVELRENRDSDGTTYTPVVRFSTAAGKEITYVESFSTSPAPYDVGEAVEVLYLAADPNKARIKGWTSLWLGVAICGGIGLIFTAIGAGSLLALRGGERKKDYLMAYGNAIETDFTGVERNTRLEVNGRNPWRVVSQWKDPASNTVRVFHSENLFFDPTQYVTRKQVTVLLDPANPKRYHMDISFLPELKT